MKSFALACIAATAFASQTFLSEPIVSEEDPIKTQEFSVGVSATSQTSKKNINWSVTAAQQTFKTQDAQGAAAADASIDVTFTNTSATPHIDFLNHQSYFTTVDTATQWSNDQIADAATGLSYSQETADVTSAWATAKSSFNSSLTTVAAEGAPTSAGTDGKFAYGVDTKIDGDWKTASDNAAWGDLDFPTTWNFLYGTPSNDAVANVIGLGPHPTGTKVTDGQKAASLLSNLFVAKTISNETINFYNEKITLGGLGFTNTATDAITAMSVKAKDSESLKWSWTQADASKFDITYGGVDVAVKEGAETKASVSVGNGKNTILPAQYYVSLASTWKEEGWIASAGKLYGETDKCDELIAALGDIIVRIDDYDFVIPAAAYSEELAAEVEITVTEGDKDVQKKVKCSVDYFTQGDSQMELGWNWFANFELVANNADDTETLSFRSGQKITNGAKIAEAGAFAALTASAAALASTLLF